MLLSSWPLPRTLFLVFCSLRLRRYCCGSLAALAGTNAPVLLRALCFLPALASCLAAETPYFAPNFAFPGVSTRLKRSPPCTKAPARCLNPAPPRAEHLASSINSARIRARITATRCSASSSSRSRSPRRCRRSRRRGSWQQRQPQSQCCHSPRRPSPLPRSARLSPRRPSSNDPAWY